MLCLPLLTTPHPPKLDVGPLPKITAAIIAVMAIIFTLFSETEIVCLILKKQQAYPFAKKDKKSDTENIFLVKNPAFFLGKIEMFCLLCFVAC